MQEIRGVQSVGSFPNQLNVINRKTGLLKTLDQTEPIY